MVGWGKRQRYRIRPAAKTPCVCFSPPKPAWRLFLEIMDTKQQLNEPIVSFVCKKRILFAQINTIKEDMQINMIYGLLTSKIRDRVPRQAVDSFAKLLEKGRDAEMAIAEAKAPEVKTIEKREYNTEGKNLKTMHTLQKTRAYQRRMLQNGKSPRECCQNCSHKVQKDSPN